MCPCVAIPRHNLGQVLEGSYVTLIVLYQYQTLWLITNLYLKQCRQEELSLHDFLYKQINGHFY